MSRAGTDRGGIRQKPEVDHAYNITRLHKIFFWSSLVMLGVLGLWIFKIDYDRPWKHHQRDFMRLRAEKTREAIQAEERKLGSPKTQKELQGLETQLTQAKSDLRSREAELDQAQKRLRESDNEYYKADQNTRSAKALYDAYRYTFEETQHEAEAGHVSHEKFEKVRAELAKLEERKIEAKLAFERAIADQTAAKNQLAQLTGDRDTAQKALAALYSEKNRLEGGLVNLETNVVNIIRNSPVMDFIAPSIKVQQFVLDDLRFDVNYQTVPRVDRCTTCHQGIDKKGYEDAPQPYTTHPDLDLYLTSSSPHPIEKVGCTVCHQGWDRSTDFTWAAHYPSDAEKKKAWEKEHGWHRLHKWEWPMLPTQYAQSQCMQCHQDEVVIPGAPTLNKGREIFEKVGCWGCHKVEGQQGPKVGPSLRSVASKSDRDWVRRWIEDPASFRPTTLMPSFFNQSNTNNEYYQARSDLEVAAITDYLFEKSEPLKLAPMPSGNGSASRGEKTLERVGCKACHLVGTEPPHTDHIRQRFGPNLMGLAAKTDAQWVYNWIKDPHAVNPDARMPKLRLTNQEALDITAYLLTIPAAEGFEAEPLPTFEESLQDEVALEYLKVTRSQRQAEIRLAEMSSDDKMLFLGEKLVGRYGCYACHDVPGFEKSEPIGVELTEEGSKGITKFDFGLVHEIPHTRWDWIAKKMEDPRIWDRGLVKEPQEKLRMPKFNLTEDQITAVTTFVLGLIKDDVAPSARKLYDPHEVAMNKGMRLVMQKNCLGCHEIREFGGDFVQFVDDPSMGPPVLTPTGSKVQPDWLFGFLKNPTTIRPWLEVRMPTFGFDDDEIATLIDMFQGISRVERRHPHFDLAEVDRASIQRGRDLFGIRDASSWQMSLKCNSCHPAGNVMPTTSPSQWGPDLGMTHSRLRADWIPDWLRDPQTVQPGTRMPNFFYSDETPLTENPERDIIDLRNYLWTLRQSGQTGRVSQR